MTLRSPPLTCQILKRDFYDCLGLPLFHTLSLFFYYNFSQSISITFSLLRLITVSFLYSFPYLSLSLPLTPLTLTSSIIRYLFNPPTLDLSGINKLESFNVTLDYLFRIHKLYYSMQKKKQEVRFEVDEETHLKHSNEYVVLNVTI